MDIFGTNKAEARRDESHKKAQEALDSAVNAYARLLAVARAAKALEGAYELEYPPNEEANQILAEFVLALAAVEDLLGGG